MAKSFSVQVMDVSRCGEDVRTIRLERPQGYSFRAGQWFRMTLDTAEGPQTRTFSHASAPGDDWIEVTTRLSDSAFKIRLGDVEPGDAAEISVAGGRLSLPEDDARPVFLTGGVGITPVRSLLRDAAQKGRRFEGAVVVLGNRDETCEPYRDEMLQLEERGVSTVRVLERAGDDWTGETGFIDAEVIGRHVSDPVERSYVIAGPPAMIVAMSELLTEIGVPVESRRVESFGKSGGD